MLSLLQNPGFRLFSSFGGEGVGSWGAMNGAKIAKKTRKRIRIRPKTADLLYRNRLINSWVFVSLFLVILHLIIMNPWVDVGIQDVGYEIDNHKH